MKSLELDAIHFRILTIVRLNLGRFLKLFHSSVLARKSELTGCASEQAA
jgi:hypothetical protein